MTVKFYSQNLVDIADLTPSTEDAQFPVSNIQDTRRTKVYRSTVASANIVFDFGTTQTIDSFFMVDSKNSPFNLLTATIQFNNVDSWGAPAISQALTLDTDFGVAKYDWTTPFNYRYARLVLTAPTFCEVSKIFIGQRVELVEQCFAYPLNFKEVNNAVIQKNRYNQRFIDEIISYREFSGSINTMTKDELDLIFEVLDYSSVTRPIWVDFSTANILNDPNRIAGYYFLNDEPTLSLQTGNYWNVNLSFQEGT